MHSHSRNSRRPLRALALAVSAALLPGLRVHAADTSTKFVMTAFTDAAGGASLVSGDYAAATAAMRNAAYQRTTDETAFDTNMCVALTMTAQLVAAHEMCNAAIHSARLDLTATAASWLWERQKLEDALAITYSNRAVLNWVSNDAVSAARDLAEAVSLSPDAQFVAHNINALHAPHENLPRNAVAQLAGAPQS